MKGKKEVLIALLFTMLFTGIFHRQAPGLNIVIFETAVFLWLLFTKQFRLSRIYEITAGIGMLVTAIATILVYSTFSYIMNVIMVFLFVGIVIYPNVKSLVSTIELSIHNLFNAQLRFIKELTNSKQKDKHLGKYLRKSRIFIIPMAVIFLFIVIYRHSNPIFDHMMSSIGIYIQEKFNLLFFNFDALILFTILVGLIVCNFMLLRTSNHRIIKKDSHAMEELVRINNHLRRSFKLIALTNEYKASVFLLVVLNAIIFVLNTIDIYWVWFNFEWQGQFLKQFVHEGTYLLILSIMISIIIVLYFFRGNLNFYKRNSWLKYLSYAWLIQNGILVISVAIRNFWYIQYFSLAYKRIGVIIFLILTLYGLYTVLIKVKQKKSPFYLFKANLYAWIVVLVVFSLVNWDNIIARYNFSKYEQSFVHLDYLSTLSDKSLPYLTKSLPELQKIDKLQKIKFPFVEKYMTPEDYYKQIELRKIQFKQNWESKSLMSWNLPEYMAYQWLYAK